VIDRGILAIHTWTENLWHFSAIDRTPTGSSSRRRSAMSEVKKLAASLVALVAIFSQGMASIATAADARQRPNVIVILTDDQGSVDAGCYGTKDVETPSIDALARQGVRFSQFYAAAPVCAPSRGGLLTGRYPQRNGVANNGHVLRASEVTMAEMFRAAGYATALVGKWHLGAEPGPNSQGFDYSFGHLGGCIDNYSHFMFWEGPNRHDLVRNGQEVFAPGKFFPDLMVDEAGRFINEHRQQPFFLYFAMNTPHYPYQGDVHWLEHYKDLKYPRNLYAAFLSTLDERIGRLLVKLDEWRLRERTIVVLQSDHGHSTEERAHFGGGSAGPYRGAKFSLFEGGIRVPAIISWPGHVPTGQVRDQAAHACDWLPTLAELTGVKRPDAELDGQSLRAVIESSDAPSPHDVLHWELGDQWAVREGPWKLIGNPKDTSNKAPLQPADRLFLANLADNPGEMRNLAAEQPEVVIRLKKLHDEWRNTVSKQ
jgi:arylsulfatase A